MYSKALRPLYILLACVAVIIGLAGSANAVTVNDGQGHTLTENVHHVVTFSNLPTCAYEDGGNNQPCSWNLRASDGNGRGLAYWIARNDSAHYVWTSRTDALHGGFHFVTKRQAHNLSSTGAHRPAYWRGCAVRFGDDFTQVRCPDGYKYEDNA